MHVNAHTTGENQLGRKTSSMTSALVDLFINCCPWSNIFATEMPDISNSKAEIDMIFYLKKTKDQRLASEGKLVISDKTVFIR